MKRPRRRTTSSHCNPPSPSCGDNEISGDVRAWRTRTRRASPVELDRQRRGHAAGDDRRHAPPRARRAARDARVGDDRAGERGSQHRAHERADDEREQRDRGERGRGAGRRAHYRGHAHGLERRAHRVRRVVALELGLGAQHDPVPEHRARQPGDVVGRDEGPPRQRRRGLGGDEQVHGRPRAGAQRHARQRARGAHDRDEVRGDLVGHRHVRRRRRAPRARRRPRRPRRRPPARPVAARIGPARASAARPPRRGSRPRAS